MFERRRSFRVPFRNKFIFSLSHGVFTATTVNLSSGGIFVQTMETNIAQETRCRGLMVLNPEEKPVSMNAIIKRVVLPTDNPDIIPGLGLSFDLEPEMLLRLSSFMDECAHNYKVAATILSYGEPDLLSLEPLIAKMKLPVVMDIGELKFHVEHVLKSIEIVQKLQQSET